MMRLIFACSALMLSGTTVAQIYECVDAQGNKEFAQVCPPGTTTQTQKSGAGTTPSDTSNGSQGSKSVGEQNIEFNQHKIEKEKADEKAAKDQADAEGAKANCDDARSQLQMLQQGVRISKIDPNTGERTYLEDKDRPDAIAKAQASADSWCNKK